MIGDGATDLEAKQEGGADLFIGYGQLATEHVVKYVAGFRVPYNRDSAAKSPALLVQECVQIYVPDNSIPAFRYGGVVERANIAAAADWYVYRIQQLIDALQ